MKKALFSLSGLIALSALAVVEHNGIKYGPGLPDGADFEASKGEADALLAVGAVKLYDESSDLADSRFIEQTAVVDSVSDAIAQARVDSEAAAAASAAASEAAAAAAAAQQKADTDAQAVADARAKLDADIRAFEEAKAAAAKVGGKKS